MGKCAICDDMACGECFQTLFDATICGNHEELEDESMWEAIGFFTDTSAAENRRYYLTEQTVVSLVVESEDEMVELYIPSEQKEEAYDALAGDSEDAESCESCHIFYSKEISQCPICGASN